MASAGLELFSIPPTDFRFEGRREVTYQPVFPGTTPITFSLPPSDDFLDLKNLKLQVEVRLSHSDAAYTGIEVEAEGARTISDADDTRNCAVVNNIAHSFRQVDVSANNILLTEQDNQYHYKAYIETVLNRDEKQGETLLHAQGWVNGALNVTPKLATAVANTDIIRNNNADPHVNLVKLEELTKKLQLKRWYTFVMKPHVPILRTGAFLVPGVSLKVELSLNPNNVYLYGTPNKGTLNTKKFPTIRDEDIKVTLVVPKMTLNASVYAKLQAERSLSKKTVKYPVVRNSIRTFSIPTGYATWEQDNVFLGKVPDRVVLALVHSTAFNGAFYRYPFAFELFGLQSVRQLINSEEYPYKTLKFSTTANNRRSLDAVGYDRLLQAMGCEREDKDPMIKPDEWGYGKTCNLLMFNNVPSGYADDPQHRNPQQTGNVKYELAFEAATTHPITVIIYSEFENTLDVDYMGGIQYNL